MAEPTVTISRQSHSNCCCCFGCCNCFHLSFLLKVAGRLKLAEMFLGVMCESLLVSFEEGSKMTGSAYLSLLSACTANASTVSLLFSCYFFSQKSYYLIRSSCFETLFNVSAAISYFSASIYMAINVFLYLYPIYLVMPSIVAFKAMLSAFMMGLLLAFTHTADAYYSFIYFKSSK